MTRPKKQHRPGGIHYVVLFGNGGQEIFQDDADRQNFIELLAVARARCNAEVFAYCLTRREARLVVRVSDVPVGRLVQRVATQYSRNNHAKYATAGYLFQHPYRAYLLEGNGAPVGYCAPCAPGAVGNGCHGGSRRISLVQSPGLPGVGISGVV